MEGFRCRALGQTAAAWRNGAFVFHMAWRMTASLRATLTFAFLKPAPLAILGPRPSDRRTGLPRQNALAAS